MVTRVILTGDTHLPRFGRSLPAALVEALTDADLVLHAGDLTDPFVLDLLAEHTPVVPWPATTTRRRCRSAWG